MQRVNYSQAAMHGASSRLSELTTHPGQGRGVSQARAFNWRNETFVKEGSFIHAHVISVGCAGGMGILHGLQRRLLRNPQCSVIQGEAYNSYESWMATRIYVLGAARVFKCQLDEHTLWKNTVK